MRRRRLAGGLVAVVLTGASFLAVPVAVPSAGAAAPAAAVAPRTRVAGPAWAPTTTPNVTNYNSPLSISCGSATMCKAVGGSVNVSGVERTLVQSWNGTAWTTSASPNVGVNSNTLSDVSCVSTTFCEAVGYYVNASNTIQTLIELWNGSYWSLASPLPDNGTTATNVLSGVSCVSTSFCEAVGYYVTNTSAIQPLIASWNGSTWSVASSPNVASSASLAAVSCVSTTLCQAVGDSSSGSGPAQTLVESWNGSLWSVTTSADSGTATNVLQGIACASASSCEAVGYFVNSGGVLESLAEVWNGTAWTVKLANTSTSSNALYAVACPAATSCQAVGYSVNTVNNAPVIQTLAEAWNGTSWAPKTSPDNGTNTNALYGVACLSTTSCLAAGSYLNSTNVIQTLVEGWNGSAWSIKTTPGGVLGDGLNAVSCESGGFCEAVGSYKSGSGAQQTLIESWYGGNWAIIPSPDIGSRSNVLTGVSCLAINFCEAVGSYLTSSGLQQTLAESWNGNVWTPTPPLNQGTGLINTLTGVSCASPSFCEAVGYSVTSGGVQQTLAETWNGSAWSIVATPTSATGNSILSGVSCASTTLCQAVGATVTSGTTSHTLVEAFNGTTWTAASSPNQGALSNALTGITCTSTTWCRAVGYDLKTSTIKQTLILAWNGTAWTLAPSPNYLSGSNELRGLSCVGTTFCQAVGDAANSKSIPQALVETWNGTAWTVASTPSTGTAQSSLGGVACLSTTSCKAAGQNDVSGIFQTLVESFG